MTKPAASCRRIDQLRAIAYDRGFSNEDARQFGKLSKTATWEALLELYLVDGESLDTVNVDTVDETSEPLDTVPEGIQAVANSRKQSDCLYTGSQSLDTSETVANSRKQSDCLYTLSEPLDKVLDSVDSIDWTNDGSFPVCGFTRQTSTSFLDWVDFGQLIALVLASAGVFVLAMSMWQQINPLNLFPPVRVNIQIGASKL
ncbi:hypothetical protein [Microcoleus sp. AT9b-C3]|uniref:hypothetical protein n=1 Tax=Microcoleus sp. AT9b-C3 TaxID=2818629 RepID=UPI002FD00E20